MVIGAWATTLRTGNLPTVWTNILMAAIVALPQTEQYPPLGALALILLAGNCAYMGGMALNDVFDMEFDRSTGAQRPLAQGDLRRPAVVLVAVCLLAMCPVAAVFAACSAGQPLAPAGALGAALVFAVVDYNAMHRRNLALAAVLMACCRGLLVLLTAIAVTGSFGPAVWIAAAAVALWTAGITVLARGERGGEAQGQGWVALFIAAALCMIPLYLETDPDSTGPLIGGLLVLLGAWIPTIFRHYAAGRRIPAVLWSLTGLCVLDMAMLLAIGRLDAAGIAMMGAAICLLLQRRMPGT